MSGNTGKSAGLRKLSNKNNNLQEPIWRSRGVGIDGSGLTRELWQQVLSVELYNVRLVPVTGHHADLREAAE
jgi:hypothetical protein